MQHYVALTWTALLACCLACGTRLEYCHHPHPPEIILWPKAAPLQQNLGCSLLSVDTAATAMLRPTAYSKVNSPSR